MNTLKFAGSLLIALFAIQPASASDVLPEDAAAQENAVRLDPISPWNVDYADERCRLSRMFGSEEQKHILFFEQSAPGPSFSMTASGPSFRRFRTAKDFALGMPSDKPVQKVFSPNPGTLGSMGSAVIYSTVTLSAFDETAKRDDRGYDTNSDPQKAQIDLDEASKTERVVLQARKRIVSFETGSLSPPFQALNACTRDLLNEWGLDSAKHMDAAYTPPQARNMQAIARRLQAVYPSAALRKGEQGFFRIRAIVEADGSVSECYLDQATIADRIVSPACKEFQKAKFDAAKDANGEPMRSFYATNIIYKIG